MIRHPFGRTLVTRHAIHFKFFLCSYVSDFINWVMFSLKITIKPKHTILVRHYINSWCGSKVTIAKGRINYSHYCNLLLQY